MKLKGIKLYLVNRIERPQKRAIEEKEEVEIFDWSHPVIDNLKELSRMY